MAVNIIYFSSVSENTKRFVEKLDFPAQRIGLYRHDATVIANDYYVLVTPTYGAGKIKGSVPVQVRNFLAASVQNRNFCLGVIVGGNTTFGEGYGSAGWLIAEKLSIPLLYTFEVLGTQEDVAKVCQGLEDSWTSLIKLRKSSTELK